MGENSNIAWTDHTHNPWWGCTRVSPGCDNCYADAWARRCGLALWDGGPRRFFGDRYWSQPLKWNADAAEAGIRRRVFCGSMCDVFEDCPSAELDMPRQRLWQAIDQTPWLDWLLLTKRPENMPTLAPRAWANGWPANVWAMATVENQETADARIPALLNVPAMVRGLSMEPLLGPVDLVHVRCPGAGYVDSLSRRGHDGGKADGTFFPSIDWVIVGGESGPHARPMHPDWARSIRNQCQDAGVPFFFKQWGEWKPISEMPEEEYQRLYVPLRKARAWESQDVIDECEGMRCTVLTDILAHDGTCGHFRNVDGHLAYQIFHVGKERAGRMLDGREWSNAPEAIQ